MENLREAVLLRRYKRFLADVRFPDGGEATVHCPNSGSMRSSLEPGWPVLLSHNSNPKRKYPLTLEMAHNGRCWIGLNTLRANGIVKEALLNGSIPELAGYEEILSEVPYGSGSRVDFLLKGKECGCFLEVKSVTLMEEGAYGFPDAVTQRGQKHLRELMDAVRRGERAVLFYLVQRSDGSFFRPAAHIDPTYASLMGEALKKGVECIVYGTHVGPDGIHVTDPIPLRLE